VAAYSSVFWVAAYAASSRWRRTVVNSNPSMSLCSLERKWETGASEKVFVNKTELLGLAHLGDSEDDERKKDDERGRPK
jgi:hypothetical protein